MSETLEHIAAALADRYAVGREIGRGGMATVFAATDERTGHEVAVKVLHRDLTVALGPARFKREIEIASSLTHPNILPILDNGEAAGSLFFVMPLIAGESLHARLEREGQLPIDEAIAIVRDVAAGLAYAHDHGIVHRDIKPENILLDDGRAVLADFGIARATADANAAQKLTGTGMTLGTPMYMSPEQAAAERELDGRTDQYSLACVLYELLAGAPPYSAPTAQGLMARHAMESIPSVRIVRESVPEQVEDALYRALSKNVVDRFPTVAAFAAALGTPDTWEHPSLRRRSPRTAGDRRRSRVRRMIYSGALALPMLSAGWAGWRYWLSPPDVAALTPDAALAARRVAVLYFDDESTGGRLTHVADGLSEALTAELAQVDALDVVSRNAVLPYRATDVPADSIGRALKVGTLVRGSVESTRDGGVQVVVRLVDAASGEGIGRAATFRQSGENVLALRDSLAATVAEFLRARIGVEVRMRESRSGTTVAAAWTLVQRAERARKDAEMALAADHPDSADLHFAHADSLLVAADSLDPRWAEPSAQRSALQYRLARLAHGKAAASVIIDRGVASAERALGRDPQNAGALEHRGTLRYLRYLMALVTDPREAADLLVAAQKDLETSVRLDKGRATAFSTLSHLYYQKPDYVSAKLAARQAYEADAFLSDLPKVMRRLYATSLDLEQLDDAAKYCSEGRRRFPDDPAFATCGLWLMVAQAEPPRPDSAWHLAGLAARLTPEAQRTFEERRGQMLAAGVLARAGLADLARRVLVRARADARIDPDRELVGVEAYVRTLTGETDEAVRLIRDYLSSNPEHRSGLSKNQSWMWKTLRHDPAFKDLVGS